MERYQIIPQQPRGATYKVLDQQAGSYFVIDPDRGGLVTDFYAGRPIFYMDESSYTVPSRYVRGGNPVLFPSVGKLTDDCFYLYGKPHTIPIHGLVRNAAWQIADRQTQECARLDVFLENTQAMLAQYPFPFSLRFSYCLNGSSLTIHQAYKNTGERPMPAAFGFHPYFLLSNKQTARLEISASQYLDMQTGLTCPYSGEIRLNQPEELGWLFLNVTAPQAILHDDAGSVKIAFQAPFRHLLVWTLPNAPFVCIEPWTAKPDALNTKEDLVCIAPGESLQTEVSYTAF